MAPREAPLQPLKHQVTEGSFFYVRSVSSTYAGRATIVPNTAISDRQHDHQ